MSARTSYQRIIAVQSRGSISTAAKALNRILEGRYRFIQRDPSVRTQVTFFDTFDWRLFNSGLALMSTATIAELTSMRDGRLLASEGPLAEPIVKAAALSSAPLRERVSEASGPRSLLKICDVMWEKCRFNIVDDIQKIIGTGLWLRAQQPPCHLVTLVPMRGFNSEINELADIIGNQQDDAYAEFIREMLCNGRRRPGAYSTHVVLNLDPDLPVHDALAKVIFYSVDIMVENLPGIVNDWDSEFLHDYRVALRRMRAVVSESKKILAPEVHKTIINTLKNLKKNTGKVRDLDVLLLRRNYYRTCLPQTLYPGLDDFFHWIQTMRQDAFDILANQIHSDDTNQSLKVLRSMAQTLTDLVDKENRTANIQAAGWIRKRLRRIVKQLDVAVMLNDEKLHMLRIDCKKLRYLLEVFASIFDDQAVEELTKGLKEFQDILGSINDLKVQQSMLNRMLERILAEGRNHLSIAASIGGVITEIARRHPKLLNDLAKAQRRFRRIVSNRRIRRTFAAQQKGRK